MISFDDVNYKHTISLDVLTRAELERLAILAEECAEVIRVVNKIIRHGYSSHHPADPDKISNRFLLETEIGHVEYIVNLMKAHDISVENTFAARQKKKSSIKKWLHHQHE